MYVHYADHVLDTPRHRLGTYSLKLFLPLAVSGNLIDGGFRSVSSCYLQFAKVVPHVPIWMNRLALP